MTAITKVERSRISIRGIIGGSLMLLIVLTTSCFCSCFSSLCNTPSELEPASAYLWSEVHDLVVENGMLYSAVGPGVEIYDVSSSGTTKLKARIAFPQEVWTVGVDHNLMFAGMQDSGMFIVDVQHPARPRVLLRFQPGGPIRAVQAVGSRLYVGTKLSLYILDISNPEEIDKLCRYDLPPEGYRSIRHLLVEDNLCFVSAEALFILDVSNPCSIRLLSTFNNGRKLPSDAVKRDTFLVIADRSEGGALGEAAITTLSIADPEHPYLISEYPFIGMPWELRLENSVLFVAAGISGLAVFDAHNLAQLTPISCDMQEDYIANTIDICKGRVFLGSRILSLPFEVTRFDICSQSYFSSDLSIGPLGDWLRIYRISNEGDLISESSLGDPGYPIAEAYNCCYSYVFEGVGGIDVIDHSTPENPISIGYISLFQSQGRVYDGDILKIGKRLFVSSPYSKTYVLDIANPKQPIVIDSVSFPPGAADLAAYGGYLYEAASSELIVIDLRNQEITDQVPLGSPVTRIDLQDTLAFVAASFAGGVVLDISKPAHPVVIDRFPKEGSALVNYIAARDTLLAFAGGGGHLGFYTASYSRQNGISSVATEPLPTGASDLRFLDSMLIVADWQTGLRFYTIDDLNPQLFATLAVGGGLSRIGVGRSGISVVSDVGITTYRDKSSCISGHKSKFREISFGPAFPNPFNSSVSTQLHVLRQGMVEVRVVNILGQIVARICNRHFEAGSHIVQWSGQSESGKNMPSGVYLIQARKDEEVATLKIVLIK